jgi:transposase
MSKYSYEFKLSVVEEYVRGEDAYGEISRRRGVADGHLREWIATYKIHGIKGLKKKYSHYSAEFRLLVLKHMWDNKLSHRDTIAAFDIRSRACLRDWEKRYLNGGIDALETCRKGRPRTMPDTGSNPAPPPDDEKLTHEALLAELKYLRMENAYLKKLKALVQAKQAPTKRKESIRALYHQHKGRYGYAP